MLRESPTFIEINLSALRHNFLELRHKIGPSLKIMAVVKSNAYGHGTTQVAPVLDEAGADFFGVGTVDEGIELREVGIAKPIVILLGLLDGRTEPFFEHRLTPVVENIRVAKLLGAAAKKKGQSLAIHLKVDTGMSRLGVPMDQWGGFWQEFSKIDSLRSEGLLSHLAEAGDPEFTAFQRENFSKILSDLEKCGVKPQWRHLANSIEAIEGEGRGCNLVRLGLVLYGAAPIPRLKEKIALKPVLSLKTRIISLKKLAPGTPVSYNRTFRTKRESRIGVLPLGYADGYPRIVSNKAFVLVRGQKVPVVGTVCMDLSMVDLTDCPSAEVGDEVVVIGRQGSEEISADDLAQWSETISYEIFCRLSPRLRRSYVEN
ncbi:MAG: alanine racemase [Deltaproteobacteria bacterium]|nr:alanine racemase [Deltaproteobacteria bacterium]